MKAIGIAPATMLGTADWLAGNPNAVARGRPYDSDLRRASSTAYYAVFHQITQHVATAVVPKASNDDVALLSRWISHRAVRERCELVMSTPTNQPGTAKQQLHDFLTVNAPNQTYSTRLADLANAFVDLQDQRMNADYDNGYSPTRSLAQSDVALARKALRDAQYLWSPSARQPKRIAQHERYHRFLFLVSMDRTPARR